jgi:Ctf8
MSNSDDDWERIHAVIPIVSDPDAIHKEWTILELNGELIAPQELPTENDPSTTIIGPGNVELGLLQFEDEKTPKLIIGSHELKGTIEHLKQPFCVFAKERGCLGDGSDPDLQYRILGIVNKKLLFKNYPKSIIRS